LTESRVDQLGRGQVYTGAQAKANGLVDQLGGFADALADAAARGGVATGMAGLPEIVVLPKPIVDPLGTLMSLRGLVSAGASESNPLAAEAPEWASPAAPTAGPLATAALYDIATATLGAHGETRAIQRLVLPLLLGGPSGIEARMPYELEFR
jgi:ClpP class serine protease